MKIVLYSNSFLPNIGGRELVVHYLARAYKRMGHQVRVLGPSGFLKHRRFRLEYTVHRWPQLGGLFKERLMFIEALLDMYLWGCDVLHAHNTFPSGYISALLKEKLKIPLIITPHGVDINIIPEIGFGHRLNPVWRKKIEYAITKADLCTAISDSIEKSLVEAGANPGKIRRISNGVDFTRFQSSSAFDVRKWLGVKSSSFLIVTVGNYHPRKGQDVLIRSMPMILKQHPDTYLMIVGRNTDPLKPLIAELSLSDRIFLLGSIEFPYFLYEKNASDKNDLLAAIYASSTIYVSAGMSEGSEGLSLAVIEAMASGLPIIASDISGNRDLIENGKTGYLVPPNSPRHMADVINTILKDSSKRKSLTETGKKIAKSYDWMDIARHYLDVYKEALVVKTENNVTQR